MLFRPKNFGCTKFVQPKFHSVETVENIESEFGGASRDRTDDLIVANDALSQLSYSPKHMGRSTETILPAQGDLTKSGISLFDASWSFPKSARQQCPPQAV